MLSINIEAKQLSENSKVFLMIVGPYQNDFASVWGHIAIWIKDDQMGIDKVYNYGGVAYEGNFIYKMLTGRLRFYLDTHQSYSQELKTYKRAKRDVDLYEMNFNLMEKRKLYSMIEDNALEENMYYRYEFYLKNCATFTFDIIKQSLDGDLKYEGNSEELTYRDVFDDRLNPFPWSLFLIRVISGSKNDIPLKREETFFIPEYMASSFSNAKIIKDGNSKPFFKNHKVVYTFNNKRVNPKIISRPIFPISVLLLLEIVLFSFSYYKKYNYFNLYDKIWFFIMSLLSIFTFLTMVFTHYLITKVNFNILWSNPMIIFVFLLKGKKKELLFKILSISFLVFILGSYFLPQEFYLTSIFVACILFLKTIKYGFLKQYFSLVKS